MAAESVAKRLKPNPNPAVIGTHNGHFHADEALAVHMLRLLPAYRDSRLVRSRDAAVLDQCHTVVDVGGEYDPARNRYDHHQRSFTTTFPGRSATKLSSAGLVYLHFGKAVIAQHMNAHGALTGQKKEKAEGVEAETGTGTGTGAAEDGADVEKVWNKLYDSFIEPVDANDNGVSKYDPDKLAAAGIEKRFDSGGYSLGAMVGRCNGNWNDPVPEDRAEAQRLEDERFLQASARIGQEFERALDYYVRAWLPARTVVQAAWDRRRELDSRGRVLVFEGQSPPWKDHLYRLEEEEAGAAGSQEGKDPVLYVLYPEKPVPGAKWRIQAVPETAGSFQSRKPLPEAWRGLRDQELDGVAGVEGCVFVHASGFTGGNKTFAGIKEMLAKALSEE